MGKKHTKSPQSKKIPTFKYPKGKKAPKMKAKLTKPGKVDKSTLNTIGDDI